MSQDFQELFFGFGLSGSDPDQSVFEWGDNTEPGGASFHSSDDILAEVARKRSPAQMRALAESLLRQADCLDQGWAPETVKNRYHWPSEAAKIERNAIELSKKAVLLKRQIELRAQVLPEELSAEPVWSMLLELFVQFAGGAKVSSKSLVIVAACPATTALRYLDRLETAGLISRSASDEDGRVRLVELTKDGVVTIGRFLEKA